MASLGKQQVNEAMASDLIKEMRGYSDSDLMDMMGMTQELEKMRDLLAKADALTGEKREKVNEKLKERMQPRISAWDIDYLVQPPKAPDSPACKDSD